jgi:type II secretory pathway component PulF
MMEHPQMLAVLFRQLATAQRRGLPAHEVAGVLAQDPEWTRAEREALGRLAEVLRRDASLPSAFGQAPVLVGAETVALLRAADASGRLADTLEVLADDCAHLAEGVHHLKLALAWPLLVATVIAGVIGVLAVFVAPAFEEAYASFNADLPVETQVFFAITGAMRLTVWVWAPLLVLLVVAWRLGWRPPAVSRVLMRAWHSVGFVQRHAQSRFVVRLLRWLSASGADAALAAAALGRRPRLKRAGASGFARPRRWPRQRRCRVVWC